MKDAASPGTPKPSRAAFRGFWLGAQTGVGRISSAPPAAWAQVRL